MTSIGCAICGYLLLAPWSLKLPWKKRGFACLTLIWLCMVAPFVHGISPSPAGGNYLALDGEDDYAVLDFDTHGALFEKGTKELTVEGWIYPALAPGKNAFAVILAQQVVFYVVRDDCPSYMGVKDRPGVGWEESDLLFDMRVYVASGPRGMAHTGFAPIALSPGEWHHIVFQTRDDRKMLICDGAVLRETPWAGGAVEHDLLKVNWVEQRNFVLGGYGQKLGISRKNVIFWDSFAGCIDEVRISTIHRYDVNEELPVPKERLTIDESTVALWHFDEPAGSEVFRDSAGKYHLTGENGASIGGPFAVKQHNGLASVWAAIKSGRWDP